MMMARRRTALLACVIAVAAHKKSEKRSEPGLFLVTHAARSGSDWLLDLLNSHDEVCIPAGKTPSSKLNGCDHHALYEKCRAADLAKSGQRMDAYFEEASAYRLAHPSGNQKRTCRVFGWKQLMRDLAGGRAFDRDTFAKWVRKRRVKMLLLRREGLAYRALRKTQPPFASSCDCHAGGTSPASGTTAIPTRTACRVTAARRNAPRGSSRRR